MNETPVLLPIIVNIALFFIVGVVIMEKYIKWRHNKWTRKKR